MPKATDNKAVYPEEVLMRNMDNVVNIFKDMCNYAVVQVEPSAENASVKLNQ